VTVTTFHVLIAERTATFCPLLTKADKGAFFARDGLSVYDPGRVKTRSVLFVGGVSGDPGGIVRLGAANSAELVRADA
jgi:hypothetical protein